MAGDLTLTMHNKEIQLFKNKSLLENFAVEKWMELAESSVDKRGLFTVALSGGTTPLGFYSKLSKHKKDLPWDKTHIFLVDERFVPFDSPDSNYGNIKKTLFEHLKLPSANIHPIPAEEVTPDIGARKYEDDLNIFFDLDGGRLPAFDLIMLGVGIDGHTASLFPGAPFSDEKDRMVVAVNDPAVEPERISMTFPVINNSRTVIFLISGRSKAKVAKHIIHPHDTNLPASRVNPVNGRLIFIIDEAAGEYLK